MKTQNFRAYLLGCINADYLRDSGYDTDGTDAQNLRAMDLCFYKEKRLEIARLGGQRVFPDWLAGLCGAVDIPYMNSDIMAVLVQFEAITEKTSAKKQEDYILTWFDFCAAQLWRMKDRENRGYKIINPKK
jgi:hypothetical protein